jgi:hypothetical protein
MENQEEYIFSITTEWVQLEAERLVGRRLTDDELSSVKKGIEWGLLADIDIIFKTAIRTVTRKQPNFDE